MALRAGALDRLISLQATTKGVSAIGEPTDAWAEVAQLWAMVEPLDGTERGQADQEVAEAPVRFTVRHRSDAVPTPEHTIVYPASGGKRHDIVSVAEIGRLEGYRILARVRAE